MDAAALRQRIEEERATELDRLGSNNLLIALTEADLDEASVLRVAAASERAARETFETWAGDATDEPAREAFAAVADREAEHEERVRASLAALGPDPEEGDEGENATGPGPMHAYLRGREDAVERVAAGMVGRSLVSLRTHAQVISFFVNEADEKRADLFRELRAETEDTLDRGLALLDERCETDEDWERARMTAEYVVRVAYDDYADSLTGMGLDPTPVC